MDGEYHPGLPPDVKYQDNDTMTALEQKFREVRDEYTPRRGWLITNNKDNHVKRLTKRYVLRYVEV